MAGQMHGGHTHRVAYLLRLWQAEREGRTFWRASLQDSDTDQRRGFATLADLLSFLEDEYGPADRVKMGAQQITE